MIPVEKNKTYEIKIAALGSNGEGIGRIEGYTVFVEGALPSETCLVLIALLSCCEAVRRMPAAAPFLCGAACV